MRFVRLLLIGSLLTLATTAATVTRAQTADYDQSPIHYSTTQPHDPVSRLQQRIAKGEVKLERSPRHGYLESLLRELKIPELSQTLVFSKTSFQRELISPENPRALYFDDDTYVGYVPGGDVIEIASTDPAIGTTFYTLRQEKGETAKLSRETESCLQCHGGSMTRDVPGLLVRSTFADSRGHPILSAGTFLTTHESPLSQRWGGWYVTGLPGDDAQMGNALFAEREGQDPRPLRAAELKNPAAYVVPHSDAAALMVLAHQAEAHNRFTRAAYAAKRALRDEKVLADALGETLKPGVHSESTLSRVKSGCDPLVEYLLFANEPPMSKSIPTAGSAFAGEFVTRGPKDSRGRSLRDFDLKTRLFRHPCSYLIYSDSFDKLPDVAKEYVYRRLWDVLSGKETSKEFSHLSVHDRRAMLEILRATKPGLPTYWKTTPGS